MLFSQALFAHPLDLGFLQLEFRGATHSGRFDVSVLLIEKFLQLPPGSLNPDNAEKNVAPAFAKTLGLVGKEGDAECVWVEPKGRIEGTTFQLSARLQCPPSKPDYTLNFPFLTDSVIPTTFQLVVKVNNEGVENVLTLSRTSTQMVLRAGDRDSFFGFVKMGIDHIGASPSEWTGPNGFKLPDGIDHILFLLALILSGGGIVAMVKTATGFTVGHSVTLALASLGLVKLPSRLVESAIALSIAYVAVETILVARPKHRWKIAAGFGLVHGFGFAAALTDLHLSGSSLIKALVGFNVGVEMGQVIIVIGFLPVLWAIDRSPQVKRFVVPGASGLIFIAASYWFVQRAFL